MGKSVENTSVFLYDRLLDKILWCVGKFQNIRDTFSHCKVLAIGMGRGDAFMIPSSNEDVIFFDNHDTNRFCFKIKIEFENTESNYEIEPQNKSSVNH